MFETSKQLFRIANALKSFHLNQQIEEQLSQATKEECAVIFEYSTLQGENKTYNVMPLDIKTRQLKNGKETVLYAEDLNENNRTKSFIIKNIKNMRLDKKHNKRNRKNLIR